MPPDFAELEQELIDRLGFKKDWLRNRSDIILSRETIFEEQDEWLRVHEGDYDGDGSDIPEWTDEPRVGKHSFTIYVEMNSEGGNL